LPTQKTSLLYTRKKNNLVLKFNQLTVNTLTMKTTFLFSMFLAAFSLISAQERSDVIAKQRNLQKVWDFKGSKAGNMYDVTHYELNLNVNPAVNYVSGTVTTLFLMTTESNMVTFDLRGNMIVDSIKFNNQTVTYTFSNHIISVNLPNTLQPGDMGSVAISYRGVPQSSGFGAWAQTTHNGAPIIWTLSEPYGAYTWWPCKQTLVDKADSVDIIVKTTTGNKVASNGLLIATHITDDGITHHWKHRHPIATYLIAIAVTNYVELLSSVPVEGQAPIQIVDYAYPESSSQWLANQQNAVNAMTALNNFFITYPYADEKYGHAQFGWGGGMEHQTMSFMYNLGEMLVVHELAHQWFGDYITCGSWADIWLNEGFATYCEGLYLEYQYGASQFKTWRQGEISDVTSLPGGSVYCYDTTSVSSIFNGRLSYAKGGMVLHMLRRQIGDEAFFQGIMNYLQDPNLANGFARTPDLQAHFEAAADTSLTEYFNDWVYLQGYPKFAVTWQATSQTAWVRLSQTPSHSSVSFFEMKVPIRFSRPGQDTTVWFHHMNNNQVFNANIGFQATQVSFDPNYEIVSRYNTVNQGQIVAVEPGQENAVTIFPNPSNDGIVFVESTKSIENLKIFSLTGKKIMEERIGGNKTEIELAKGIYLLNVTLNDNSSEIRKIVVQ
jgi:aminopeptidase N